MLDELTPQVFVGINTAKLLRSVVIMSIIMSGLGCQLSWYVEPDYRRSLSTSLLIILWVYYLARVISSCDASLLIVRGHEIEVFDVMGKKLGSFASENVAIGASKRVEGGFQVPLLFNGWAKVDLLLSADDELRLRGLIRPKPHDRPRVPYVAIAFVIPLAIMANVSVVSEIVKVREASLTLESALVLFISDAALLAALVCIRLRGHVSLRGIVQRIL